MSVESIQNVAEKLGVPGKYVVPYGRDKAKVDLEVLSEVGAEQKGKYILVTGMTPTPLGEGKTVTTIGLSMGLNRVGKRAVANLRQSSLGPVFGIKGGGAGGGRSQVIPLKESILHMTGDFHAVGQAHNLIAALTDNHWFHGNELKIDPEKIQIKRAMDVNDRFLRHVTVRSKKSGGMERMSGFDITSASELMAILALVDGKSTEEVLANLRERIGKVVVAFDDNDKAITAEDVKAAGSAAVCMTETIHPNLMQTTEHTPVLIHAGPFANIAHGASSIVADRVGLSLSDYVVTEAGFGMDLGGEKFFDIKCRKSGLRPSVTVLVASVRAMKYHTGNYKVVPGKPLPEDLSDENPDHVMEGGVNLKRQIESARAFGVPVIVAVNRFPTDHDSEIEAAKKVAIEAGAVDAIESSPYTDGGAGSEALAQRVIEVAESAESNFEFLYPDSASLEAKIRTVAQRIYGADDIELSEKAVAGLKLFTDNGFGELPICMAKTNYSISHDGKKLGNPSGYTFPIRDVRLSAGAGFVYPLAGSILTMPGLKDSPAAHRIDIDAKGEPIGLY
jgi:formate--tetrahydrofolate ligase